MNELRVAVLGAGSWGTAVANLTARNSSTVLWARRPEIADEIGSQHTNERYLPGLRLHPRLEATDDLAAAVSGADVVVVGVPSHGFRDIVAKAAPFVRPWVPLLSLTKGFEAGTLARPTQILDEEIPGHPVGLLTGPNLAREIVSGQAAASVIAMAETGPAEAIQRILSTGLFRVYTNTDVIGSEVAGALKNVIAIATGIAQGLGVGDNTRSMVITRGLSELTRLGVAMGGRPETFAGLAGMGDLLATCMSPYSRNRTVGEQLGAGRTLEEIIAEMHMVAEGVKTASLVMELAERYGVELPICSEIHAIVHQGRPAAEAYRGLMDRPAGAEADSD